MQEIERLNRIIRQFGELHEIPGRTLYAINLALDEIVTNVVLYGFEDATGQEIVIRLDAAPDQVRASVTDQGREFDPHSVPPPNLDAPLGERLLGGLGIHLVRSLMDQIKYARANGKNELTRAKRIR